MQRRRMRRQRGQRGVDIVAQRAVFARLGVYKGAVQPKAAGLESVEGVRQVVVFCGLEGLLHADPARQALHQTGHGRCLLYGQRGVQHPHLNRSVFGLGTYVPVKVFHALDDTGARHLAEVDCEVIPGQHKGRAARQRNQVRNKTRQPVQQHQGLVRPRATNVYMLARRDNHRVVGWQAVGEALQEAALRALGHALHI